MYGAVQCGASHFIKRDNFAVAVIVLISCSRVTLIIFTQIFKLPVSVFQSIINCKSVIRIFRNDDHNNHIVASMNQISKGTKPRTTTRFQ